MQSTALLSRHLQRVICVHMYLDNGMTKKNFAGTIRFVKLTEQSSFDDRQVAKETANVGLRKKSLQNVDVHELNLNFYFDIVCRSVMT